MKKPKPKFNRKKFIDPDGDTAIYGDYLPTDIIRNEVFTYVNQEVSVQFILWKMLSEQQEKYFLTELKSRHNDEILSIQIEKPKEQYLIIARN
jgi:hypothetical protein